MDRKVLIDYNEYNELLDFKKNIESESIAFRSSGRIGNSVFNVLSYKTVDETIERLLDINQSLKQECEELERSVDLLKNEICTLRKRTLFNYIRKLIG